jgi:acetyl esterase
MFGPTPVNDRGTPLDVQTHALLSLIRASKQPEVHQLPLRQARRYYDDATTAMDVKAPWEIKTFHGFVPGKRPVAYEVYRPHHVKSRYAPAIMFFHGGGFVIGSAQGHAAICKYIAHATDCVVINVDYALAPENPFPAGIEDAVRAFAHIAEHRRELGIDDQRIFVMGDSAGANLSINVSQHQILSGDIRPFAQILFFPTTDDGTHHASRNTFADGFLLSKPLINYFSHSYLGSMKNIAPNDHRVMPLHFERTSELPQTLLLTCGFDPLRDEGEAYAARLNAAGVPLIHRDAQNMIHGFLTMGGVLKTAKDEIDRVVPQILSFLDT